jgi:hypothetical protein
MRTRQLTGFCCAVAVGVTASVYAQQPAADPAQRGSERSAATEPSRTTTDEKQVTVTGCVRSQGDVFETRGLLTADELVLTDVASGREMSGGTDEDRARASRAERAVGTSGAAAAQAAATMYSLSGDKEDDLETLKGRKVEITGHLEHAGSGSAPGAPPAAAGAADPADAPTGGTDEDAAPRATNTGAGQLTGGQPRGESPEAVEGIRAQARVDALPRLQITSFRDLGSCK